MSVVQGILVRGYRSGVNVYDIFRRIFLEVFCIINYYNDSLQQ